MAGKTLAATAAFLFFVLLYQTSAQPRCPRNKPAQNCTGMDPCDTETCENITDAICQLDNCGGCFAKFLLDNDDVTDSCGKCLPAEGQQVDLTSTSTTLSCLQLSNGFVQAVMDAIVASGQLQEGCMMKVLEYECKMKEKDDVQTTTFSLSILILCNKCEKFNGNNAPKDPKDIDITIPNISTVTFMSETVQLQRKKAKNPGLYCKCKKIKGKKGKKGRGNRGRQELCDCPDECNDILEIN